MAVRKGVVAEEDLLAPQTPPQHVCLEKNLFNFHDHFIRSMNYQGRRPLMDGMNIMDGTQLKLLSNFLINSFI